MCEKTKVLYSCGCYATVKEFCTLVENDPAAPCPMVRDYTGTEKGICPSCTDKLEEKQRKERKKKKRERGNERREREQQLVEEEEERSRDLVRAQAYEAGYNDARRRRDDELRRQEAQSRSYGAGNGYARGNSSGAAYAGTYGGEVTNAGGVAAEDAYEAEMRYAQGVVAENQRRGAGRSSRERGP